MDRTPRIIFTTLCISIFITVAGVGIVVPLLPVYAHKLGGTGFSIGLIFGAFSISRTVLLPYFGVLSDRKGRKPFIVTGFLLYALISFAFIFADRIDLLILIRFVQGAASAMMMPVIQAYIGDITPVGKEGRAMGIFSMATFLGLSMGPFLGGLINDQFGLRVTFVCMGVAAFIAYLLNCLLLPAAKRETKMSRAFAGTGLKVLVRDREILLLAQFRIAYAAGIGILWGFLPVFADAELGLSSTKIGILVTAGILVSGLLQTPMGYLADRMNKKKLVICGGVFIGGSLVAFYPVGGFNDILVISILFGVGGGISMPALNALAVMKGSRTGAMGSVMALMNLSQSLGMLIGSLLAGLMIDAFHLRAAFPAGSLLVFAACIVFGFGFRNPK